MPHVELSRPKAFQIFIAEQVPLLEEMDPKQGSAKATGVLLHKRPSAANARGAAIK